MLQVGKETRLIPIDPKTLDEWVSQSDRMLRVHFDVRSFGGVSEPTGIVRVVLGTMLLCTCDIRTWETTYASSIQIQSDTSLIKAQLSAFIHEAVLSWNDTPLMGSVTLSGDLAVLCQL